MKRIILSIILIGAVIVGAIVWRKQRLDVSKPAPENAAADKSGDDEPEKPRVTRDAEGHVVITMDDETQGNIGLLVAHPAAAQMSPEVKGYGRVLDATTLAALMTELASFQAAYAASSNDLVRLKTLEGQGNASTRVLQTAEAAALHDQLAIQSAKDRLALSWGRAVADRNDLAAFVQSLTSSDAALVRIDLPAGEVLPATPRAARILTLLGNAAEAEFLGVASNVDPQTQGRGFIFLIKPNASRLLAGEAVIGYLKVPGEPLSGVIIPREAVVRTEGAGWIYVLNKSGDAYTRIAVALDRPADTGWFVSTGLTPSDHVVIRAAEQLLSTELQGQGGGE